MSPVLLSPSPWDETNPLSLFQRALIWAYCKPDKMVTVCKDLVLYTLGGEMSQPLPSPPLPVSKATLLLAKKQEDVLLEVQQKGHQAGVIVKTLYMMSDSCKLEAEQLLLQSARYGYWIVLSNCECVKEWSTDLLRTLYMLVNTLNDPQQALPNKVHFQFKLILLSSLDKALTLPPVLLEGFVVRTYCPNNNLTLQQSAGSFHLKSSLQKALIALHSFLTENCEGIWTSDDLFSTLHLLTLANSDIDMLECARSIVAIITYGSKNTTESQTSFLHSAIEKFLSVQNEEIVSNPSFLHISLGSLPTLPDIPKTIKHSNIMSTLQKLTTPGQAQDITMVTDHLLSVLPIAPCMQSNSITHTAVSQFLSHQAGHYTSLIEKMSQSLSNVHDILEGDKTINEPAKEIIQHLTKNEVPTSWDITTLDLAHWVYHLCERVECLKSMIGSARNASEMSGRQSSTISNVSQSVDIDRGIVYSLPIFTSPRAFILSYIYDWGNCNNVTLSDVTLRVKVVSLVSSSTPENGLYIDGLEMHQAGWDSKKGTMYPTNKAPPFPLPLLLLQLYSKTEGVPTQAVPQMTVDTISCPLLDRNGEYVSDFVLPSGHSLAEWGHSKPYLKIL